MEFMVGYFSDDRGCGLLPEIKHAVILLSMHSFKRNSMTITSRTLAAEQTINKGIAGQYLPVNINPLGIFTVSFVQHLLIIVAKFPVGFPLTYKIRLLYALTVKKEVLISEG